MERSILSHPAITEVLSNYHESLWNRVIIALILKGIHSIKSLYPSLELSVEELEGNNKVMCKEHNQIPNVMDELKAIKSELFKLDKKIDQSARTTRKDFVYHKEDVPIKSVRYEKKRNHQPKSINRHKSTSEVRAIKNIKLLKLRSNYKSLPKKSTLTKKKRVIKRTPSYLKNVQSRILSNIERDKIQYKMQKHEINTQSKKQQNYSIRNADKYLDNTIINHFTKARTMNNEIDMKFGNMRGYPMEYKEVNNDRRLEEQRESYYPRNSTSQFSNNAYRTSPNYNNYDKKYFYTFYKIRGVKEMSGSSSSGGLSDSSQSYSIDNIKVQNSQAKEKWDVEEDSEESISSHDSDKVISKESKHNEFTLKSSLS